VKTLLTGQTVHGVEFQYPFNRAFLRNCLLKHVVKGKIEGTKRRKRRRKQLLDDLKQKRRFWNLKAEALDRTLWRTRFDLS